MKIRLLLLAATVVLIALGAPAQETIPTGTILPVELNTSLSSNKSKAGGAISARVAQDVPLPNGMNIREGAKIAGHVVEVRPASPGSPAQISFAFDRVVFGKRSLAVTTNLRALPSFTEVDSAQIPPTGMGEGDTWSSRVTVQVGGDVVYWGGGPVDGRSGPVGKPVDGVSTTGVLVNVSAKPGSACHGEIGDHRGPQALWIFSSDACGIYGLDRTTIAHAGRTEPRGVITLSSESRQVAVSSGSALLQRVIAP